MKKTITNILIGIFSIAVTVSCGNANNKIGPTNTESESEIVNEDSSLDSILTDSFEIIDGWLKLGLKQETIIEKLGEPTEKGLDEYWGATGTYNQEWKYETLGIILGMESEVENGTKTVCSITLFEPCTLKTSRMIGIGTDAQLVNEKYSELIDSSFSSDESIVVGSIYGGVIFNISDKKVNKIFVGASAE
jgi:hypothetical protein